MKKLFTFLAVFFMAGTAGADVQTFPCFFNSSNLLSCLINKYSIVWPVGQGTTGTTLLNDGFGNLTWGLPAGGTVTNVTGTAPVNVASGSTTPVVSMHVADSGHDGYLAAGDWTAFNGKVPSGRLVATTAPLNGGHSLATDVTLGIDTASATTDGQLLHTDWVTFNSKGAIGSPVVGGTSGSTLYVDGSNNLGQDNANYFWDATNHRLGIGMSAPTATLDLTTGSVARVGGNIGQAGGIDLVDGTGSGGGFIKFYYNRAGEANVPRGQIQSQLNHGMQITSLNFGGGIVVGSDGDTVFGNATDINTVVEKIRFTNAGNVGIGTTAPGTPLEVAITPSVNSVGGIWSSMYGTFGNTSNFVGRYSRGTPASPSAVLLNDNLMTMSARGYDGSVFSGNTAAINMYAAENFTPTAHGSLMTFRTTPAGTTANAIQMLIGQSGNVGINTVNPAAKLDIVSNTASLNSLHVSTGSSGQNSVFIDHNNANTALNVSNTGSGTGIRVAQASNIGPAESLFNSGTSGLLTMYDTAGIGTLTLKAPASITSHTWTLPAAQGAASTFLKNDGAGNLSWAAGGGGSAIGSPISGGRANSALFVDPSGNLGQTTYDLILPASQGGPNTAPINDGAGNISWAVPGIVTGSTVGGAGINTVLYAGSSGNLSADSSNFHYNEVTHRLGVGTASPTAQIEAHGLGADFPLKVSAGGDSTTVFYNTPGHYNWIAGSQYHTNEVFEITPSTATSGSTFNTAAISITKDGLVGINKNVPTQGLDVNGTVKLGAAGSTITAMGSCTVSSTTLSTAATNLTCTTVPASVAVMVQCSGQAASTTPAGDGISCRSTGAGDQIACNRILVNAVAMAYTCLWTQP